MNNTGFWVVIGLAAIGGVGYFYYKKNVEPKVNSVKSTTRIFGIF